MLKSTINILLMCAQQWASSFAPAFMGFVFELVGESLRDVMKTKKRKLVLTMDKCLEAY